MKQLDLFDSPPKPSGDGVPSAVGAPPSGATVIPFPQQRNIGRARHVAQKLVAREGKSKQSYWRRSCADLASMLSRAGLNQQDVERQLSAFRDAVGVELGRITDDQQHCQPGGAA